MAETTEKPWEAPSWQDVAKASGVPVESAPPEGVVGRVKKAVKPWLEDWGIIARESEKQAPKKAPAPPVYAPSPVDVSTEAKMKKAITIQPHERQPDTQSLESNLAEIDLEISRKNIAPREKAILIAHRETMIKGKK